MDLESVVMPCRDPGCDGLRYCPEMSSLSLAQRNTRILDLCFDLRVQMPPWKLCKVNPGSGVRDCGAPMSAKQVLRHLP